MAGNDAGPGYVIRKSPVGDREIVVTSSKGLEKYPIYGRGGNTVTLGNTYKDDDGKPITVYNNWPDGDTERHERIHQGQWMLPSNVDWTSVVKALSPLGSKLENIENWVDDRGIIRKLEHLGDSEIPAQYARELPAYSFQKPDGSIDQRQAFQNYLDLIRQRFPQQYNQIEARTPLELNKYYAPPNSKPNMEMNSILPRTFMEGLWDRLRKEY